MFIRALAGTQKAVISKLYHPKSINGDENGRSGHIKGSTMCCGAELFASLVTDR